MASVLKNNIPPIQQASQSQPQGTAPQAATSGTRSPATRSGTVPRETETPHAEASHPPARAAEVSGRTSVSTRTGLVSRLPAGTKNDPGGATGLAGFNLDDFAERGREQLRLCQRQIQQQLEHAQQQAEKIRAEAKQRGYEEGRKQAAVDAEKRLAREAEAKARAQLNSLHQAVAAMHAQYDQWMSQYAQLLTGTVLAATERILRAQLQQDSQRAGFSSLPHQRPQDDERGDVASVPTSAEPNPAEQSPTAKSPTAQSISEQGPAARSPAETDSSGWTTQPTSEPLVVRWAREALHSTRSAARLTLAVHPDTLAEIGGALDELLADPDLPEQSTVLPDETLAVGDVVVRQDGGEIRAGLQAQLERLREELQA